MIGTSLGGYQILAKLGAGGMGEVYRARDTKLDRDVAIKILPESVAADPDRLQRFEREAKTLAALNHQNIAHVYDAGREGGVSFLVMEMVEGEDLSAAIARGAMSPAVTLPIVRQLVDALETAHEAGIVHRDLKPANIKLRLDGAVKVLDFGLAKLTAADGPASAGGSAPGATATMTSPAVTAMGVILGTASYMSPEQARGRAVDKRADIWAFGAVWFEMLTGRAPFPGETITDVIAAVVTREPEWSQLPAGTPPLVRRLLGRCLEKDPKARLRDIGEVRLALAGDPLRAEVPARTSQSRFGAAGWAAAAVLLVLLAASVWWPRRAPESAAAAFVQYDIVPPAKSTLRIDSRPAVAVAPDGSAMVFAATEDGVARLYLRRRDDPAVRPIPGTEGASDPTFSPSGRWLAFGSQGRVMRMTLDGRPTVVTVAGDSRGMAWLDEERIVMAVGTATPLAIVSVQGGDPRPLTTLDSKSDDRSHRWPAVTPDGKAVLFTVGKLSSPDNYDDSRIDAVIVATGERRHVMEGASFVRVLPGGFLAYAKAGIVYAVPFDSDRLVTTGAAVPVLQNVASDPTTGAAHAAFGPDGTATYIVGGASTEDRQIVWADRKGTVTPIPLRSGLYNDIKVSPDGSRIAVLIGASGSGDVWIYDTHSTAFTPLTSDRANATPVWSHDGKSIYYTVIKSTGDESVLFRRRADGSGSAEPLASMKARAYLEAIDRAEKAAYLTLYEPTAAANVDAVMIPVAGGEPTVLVGGPPQQANGVLSPDGRWLAYQSDEGGRAEIYVRDLTATGGRYPISTTGGEEPRWSTTGDELFYRNDSQFMSAKITTTPAFRSNPPVVLFDGVFNLRSDTGMTYDLDRKSGRFAMLRPAGQAAGAPAARVRVMLNWLQEVRRATKQQ